MTRFSIPLKGQSHERKLATGQRCGFFVGDGAGVGKGRTIAGIILEGILSKRTKAIWLSISSDLKIDAQRQNNFNFYISIVNMLNFL